MLQKHIGFNIGFALLFIVQLITESSTLTRLLFVEDLHYYTKPLITLSLFGLLAYQTGLRGRFSKRVGTGLLFGLAGDVSLMFDSLNPSFFTYGLVCFLIGHICYASAFYIDYSLNKDVYKKYTKKAIIGFGLFSIALCGALWMYIDGVRIPVILYGITISLMGIMSVNRFGRVNSLSFKITFAGALLFMVSDSILAIDRFMYRIPLAGVMIMATYMLAQYLITFGNIERKIKKKVEEII